MIAVWCVCEIRTPVLTAPPNFANGSPDAALGVGSTPNLVVGAATDMEGTAIGPGIELINEVFCAGAGLEMNAGVRPAAELVSCDACNSFT